MTVDTNHVFYCSSKKLEAAAVDFAFQEAHKKARQSNVLLEWESSELARRICDQALQRFSTQLKQEFPSEEYKKLVYLTINSRITPFCYFLKEKITQEILDQQSKQEHSRGDSLAGEHFQKPCILDKEIPSSQ